MKDFEAAVERLTDFDLGPEPARRNPSLSAEQTAILLQLRRRLPREAEGVFHPKSHRLIALFEAINEDAVPVSGTRRFAGHAHSGRKR